MEGSTMKYIAIVVIIIVIVIVIWYLLANGSGSGAGNGGSLGSNGAAGGAGSNTSSGGSGAAGTSPLSSRPGDMIQKAKNLISTFVGTGEKATGDLASTAEKVVDSAKAAAPSVAVAATDDKKSK
jgi:preprotein translocase subunit SecG